MIDIMLDLETMGALPDSAIVSIGAVRFDLEKSKTLEEFYQVINLKSSLEKGLTVQGETILWWMKQNERARLEIASGIRTSLETALTNFSEWISGFCDGDFSSVNIWGNGAVFDNVILSSSYRVCGLRRPWEYKGDRCYRTVSSLFPDLPFERAGTYHRAVDDARSQALHLIKIFNNNKKGN